MFGRVRQSGKLKIGAVSVYGPPNTKGVFKMKDNISYAYAKAESGQGAD